MSTGHKHYEDETENQPAFPTDVYSGLTKREFFAAHAMQGLLASKRKFIREEIARDAVIYGDAVIAELDKTEE